MANGNVFKTGTVDEWMDCGNKEVTIATNRRMLGFLNEGSQRSLISQILQNQANSKIIEPCFIGEGVTLINSTVGPFASIGANTTIEDSNVKNSIIQTHHID